MPSNTPKGFPYPLPTEPVAEGAAAIRSLAEAVDQKTGVLPICTVAGGGALPRTIGFTAPFAIARGLLVVSLTANNPVGGLMAVGVWLANPSSAVTQTKLWAQAGAYHWTLPSLALPFQNMPAGSNAIGIRNDLNAAMDSNDFVTAYILVSSFAPGALLRDLEPSDLPAVPDLPEPK